MRSISFEHAVFRRFILTSAGTAVMTSGAGVVFAVPAVLDPTLEVTTVVSGLNQPTGITFVGPNDFFVTEKTTGRVRRVTNGVVGATALDLPVNGVSERGLLGFTLAPDFATSGFAYAYWTESNTGADSGGFTDVSLLANRVDRFKLDVNGTAFNLDLPVARFRALQTDAGQSPAGNHNGGKIKFGQDGKLYVQVGDVGRRGWFQNLPNGPTGGPDDQFGGPQPDNAHFTGVVVRLNPDGSAPPDNPFFATGGAIGGEAGSNVQKTYAYGFRNGFGMAVDPQTGRIWTSDNGDDSFDEINLVSPGTNGGWVQAMGPVSRVAQYKDIEVNQFPGGLQQNRWPATNIADKPAEALQRMFSLPGSAYSDPELSWKYAVAPSALGFLSSNALGLPYAGNLFVGASTSNLDDGYLFRLVLDGSRQGLVLSDPALLDLVADNTGKFGAGESGSLRFGTGFGTTTEIVTGPDGALYVVSLSSGSVYRIGAAAAIPEPGPAMAGTAGGLGWAALRRRRRRC